MKKFLIARRGLADNGSIDWKAALTSGAAIFERIQSIVFLRAEKIGFALLLACVLLRSSGPLHFIEFGEASWYGPGFQGLKTASGEIFNTNKLVAAHPTLPIGTRVEVTNLAKNKKVDVRIIDRGPYVSGRVIDLSRAAAKKLGMVREGTAEVRIEVHAVKMKNL